jgi:putative hydrolase of the HAD superfamily
MQNIKNIIFDFGGVILNIDFNKTINAFVNLGIDRFSESFTGFSQSQVFNDLETGKSSPAEFYEGLRTELGVKLSNEQIAEAWNALLLDLPPHRVDILKSLKNNYRLFLLSNTNQIHFESYNSRFKQDYGYDFSDLFEHAYWSFNVKKRKPDTEIFEHVLTSSGLNPSETLFIDDSYQHIEGARKLGIKTLHLHGIELKDLFENGSLRADAPIL